MYFRYFNPNTICFDAGLIDLFNTGACRVVGFYIFSLQNISLLNDYKRNFFECFLFCLTMQLNILKPAALILNDQ